MVNYSVAAGSMLIPPVNARNQLQTTVPGK